jgi:hypothetical protein
MPGVVTSPYDSAEYCLNLTRSLGNDAIQSLAGSLLSDGQPYVVPYLNSAYRYIQRRMANSGVQTFKRRIILTQCPKIYTPDPGLQCEISYTGFFDGALNHATPTLPADMCWPLRLRERQSGTTNPYQQMWCARDGLQSRPQSIFFRDWTYQQDKILLNGATLVNDIELLYVPFLPDIQPSTVLPLGEQQILILRAENAIAAFTLAEFANARGSPLAGDIRTMGEQYLREVINSDAMQKQRGNYRRQPYSRRAHSGWNWY